MQYSDDLVGQRQRRLEIVQKLKELGIDPYPSRSKKDASNGDVLAHYDDHKGKELHLTGRLTRKRDHGKLIFGDIEDQSGKIQICVRQDTLKGDVKHSTLDWENLNLLDIGDFVEVFGKIDKTEAGQITLFVGHIKLLTKAIRPLPNILEDKEQRFRRRYVDMALHSEVRQRFERRSKFWQAVRDFLNSKSFVEVNLPILEHVTGGADARPFVTRYDALDQNFYLRISHELPLKRLLGGGFDKVYDIGARFRNEGFSDEHLPEHVAMEWYWAYADYTEGMKFSEELYRYVMKQVYGTLQFKIREFEVDLEKPWEEIKFAEVIQKHLNIDIFTDSVEKMNEVLKKHGVDLGNDTNKNRVVDNLWKVIRKTIAGPVFLTGTPKFLSPLAKSNPDNLNIVDRFQIIIAGSELGNAWSELNDPVDQLERFQEQQNMREAGDDEAQMLDIDYVEMLEYGMPPAVGFGFSERVFWFFENVTAREGVPFPQLKTELDETTKKIYNLKSHESTKATPKSQTKNVPSTTDSHIDYKAVYPKAVELLNEYIKNENLKRHCYDVEKAMRFYAKKLGEDEYKWAVAGLLHDIDWETNPDTHPNTAVPLLKELGAGQEVIDAILGHAYERTNVARESTLAHYLFACDEITGFINAYSRMKSDGLAGVEAKSVIKKMKDKGFAKNVSRDDMVKGAEAINLDLEEHVGYVIEAMKA